MAELKRTPLYDKHVGHGARMVPFAGWEMPVQYSGIKDEHLAVREAVGLFDVSHMGQFEFRGPRVVEFLDYLTANDVKRLEPGNAHYSMLLNERGGTVDDIIVYLLEPDRAMMVVNAGNLDKDWAHVAAQASTWDGVEAENQSDQWALLAVQGPRAEALINELTDVDATAIPYYGVQHAHIGATQVILARTGYTGEDGFEVFTPAEQASAVWERVVEAGAAYGLRPAGLGARDTLRLEASMPLYGHELDEETSPIEAGLGFFVAKEGEYLGAARQRELRKQGAPRRLVMLRLRERGIAREGTPVLSESGDPIGHVTSGTHSPYLNEAIAQAFVPPAHARPGTVVHLEVRGRRIPAEVVKRPFYKRIS